MRPDKLCSVCQEHPNLPIWSSSELGTRRQMAALHKKGQGAVDELNGQIDQLQKAKLKYALPPPSISTSYPLLG